MLEDAVYINPIPRSPSLLSYHIRPVLKATRNMAYGRSQIPVSLRTNFSR
jgi:hypothetical protein